MLSKERREQQRLNRIGRAGKEGKIILEGRLKAGSGTFRLEVPEGEVMRAPGKGAAFTRRFTTNVNLDINRMLTGSGRAERDWGESEEAEAAAAAARRVAAEEASARAPTDIATAVALTSLSSVEPHPAGGSSNSSSSLSSSGVAALSWDEESAARSMERLASGSGASASSPRLSPKDVLARRQGDTLLMATEQSLSYLDGHLPGDYGFDPLGLFDPDINEGFVNQQYIQYSEVLHGRWAMLGVLGAFLPEYLAAKGWGGIAPDATGLVWFRTGFLPPAGSYDWGRDLYSVFWLQTLLMAIAEARRFQDFLEPGSLATRGPFAPVERALLGNPQNPIWPGGPVFNCLAFVESPSMLEEYKAKEIKHGRIAMVAMLGFVVQAMATHEGPYENLVHHMADPLHNNVVTTMMRLLEEGAPSISRNLL